MEFPDIFQVTIDHEPFAIAKFALTVVFGGMNAPGFPSLSINK